MKTYKEFRKSIGFPVKEKKVEEVIRSEKPLKEDVVDQLRSVVKKNQILSLKVVHRFQLTPNLQKSF